MNSTPTEKLKQFETTIFPLLPKKLIEIGVLIIIKRL